MDYQKHYDRLITKYGSWEKPKGAYVERHRKLPKCMGGAYVKGNAFYMSARAHYVAHLLLAKIHPKEPGLWTTVYFMNCLRRRKGSRMYQAAKVMFSAQQIIIGKRVGASNYARGIGLAAMSKEDRIKWAKAGGILGGAIGGRMGNVEGKRRSGIACRDAKKGFHDPEVQRKGAKIAGGIAKESGQIYELQKQVAVIGGRVSGKQSYENKDRIFAIPPRERSELSRKNGLANWLNGVGIFAMTPEERSNAGRKAAASAKKNGTGIFGLTTEDRVKTGTKSCLIRYRCAECNYENNAGNLAHHHRKTGHVGKVRL